MNDTRWERVTAAELQPGDTFAEARSHEPMTVHEIGTIGASARRIYIGEEYRDVMGRAKRASIRPRHTKRFWRVIA